MKFLSCVEGHYWLRFTFGWVAHHHLACGHVYLVDFAQPLPDGTRVCCEFCKEGK